MFKWMRIFKNARSYFAEQKASKRIKEELEAYQKWSKRTVNDRSGRL